jgi:threonine aldolase
LAEIPGLRVERPETNLVFFDTAGIGLTALELVRRLRRKGVMISAMGHNRARACTYVGIDEAAVQEALEIIRSVIVG